MSRPPLVILGFDAGDPDFLLRWAREGHLPTLASVLQRGCWAKTGGPELISEHGVWLQLFSGLSRGQLGYHYFRQLRPRTYDLQLVVTGRNLGAAPFWAAWRDGDKRVAILDLPDVHPVPGLPGLQLTNWSVHRGWVSHDPADAPHAEPPGLLDEARRIAGARLEVLENSNSDFAEDQQLHRRLLEQTQSGGRLYRDLLRRDRFDLTVVVFSASHTAGHQFWKHRAEAGGTSELRHAIRDVYQAVDREMGLLLAQMPAETNVVIASSVGLGDYCPTGALTEAFCRQLGYQVSPPHAPSLMGTLRRLVPETWRVAVSRHFSRETRERLLADQFRGGTDWSKTTAFAVPSAYTGFVRVNLRGREPQGIVAPGAEYAELLRRLEDDLRQLVDPATGEPAVQQVARAQELFGADAHEALPDLFVIWKPSSRFRQKVVHPQAEIAQRRPEWYRDSDHSQNGFVAAAGSSIRARGALGEIELLDLAPTFLALMNEPVPKAMRGNVRTELLGTPCCQT